ncbi:ABC-2 type transporter-domain-containing protein [Copromyces sp. CBS 386.78]|nr:ABC-2 type transporter-domain-containing protein [Copromyces sp. CBS 386.78]
MPVVAVSWDNSTRGLESPEYKALQEEIEHYEQESRGERKTEAIAQLQEQKGRRQAKHVRPKSPYTISIAMQVKACTVRAYQLWGDRTATFTMMLANLVLALIIGSIFYGNPDATAGFAGKGSVLFMAILLNALTAITEINALYAQRPMVEKYASFAFYHPACEAAAGIVADIPIKFATATISNILAYFLAGLRREPGQFFLYFIVSSLSTFIMSAFFRTIAASTKTVSQALALAGVLVLALIIYTGYIVPVP